ncbi:diguanylate cyclase domain-containing protein [Pseudomonas sp. JQ36]
MRKAQEYNNDYSRHSGSNYFPKVLIGCYHSASGCTLHTLPSRADHAMYQAKQTGRNRTCVEMPHSPYA